MPGRVLVVEDSANSRKLIRLRLSAAYYDVIEASDGAEALELALSQAPDLILLDVIMRGMDGFEVCRRLKLDSATAHCPCGHADGGGEAGRPDAPSGDRRG